MNDMWLEKGNKNSKAKIEFQIDWEGQSDVFNI